MIRRKLLWLCCALLLLSPGGARAQTAGEITRLARITASNDQGLCANMLDRRYTTGWRTKKGYAQFDLPADSPCYGVYICLSGYAVNFSIQTPDKTGKWRDVLLSDGDYLHRYLPLDGLTSFRIQTKNIGGANMLSIAEIYLLAQGELPAYVQQWQTLNGKADLMFLTAHPDDELIWFGGALPTYAGERGLKVQVVCMTTGEKQRKNELLDALWTCGDVYYPVIGPFNDKRADTSADAFKTWGGTKTVYPWVVGQIRKYQPDVMLSHDTQGEYGHGAHRATASSATHCVPLAARAGYAPESASVYGVWQVKKLYLHLYENGRITMNWRLPLSRFEGKTSFEVAAQALKKHVSQHPLSQEMKDGGPYDCSSFGLHDSVVGPDTGVGDFFEHLPQETIVKAP